MRTITTLSFVAIMGTSAYGQTPGATADHAPASSDTKAWTFGIEPRFGALIPTSKLHTYVVGGLELDYAIGSLAIGLEGSLSRPSYDGTVMDPRIPGGTGTYSIAQTEFVVGLLATYRFSTGSLVPRVGAGPILHMLRSNETTDLAPGENTGQQTKLGFEFGGGLDYAAGPGYLAVDLRVLYSGLDTHITGSTNAGNVAVMLGYRAVF